jgi:hypothetical protein
VVSSASNRGRSVIQGILPVLGQRRSLEARVRALDSVAAEYS